MAKVAVTFRLDAELVKRLKDTAARSGGKISQAEIVESALADRFAVKDGTKLLAKVNQDQNTALTLVKEQSTALETFKNKVATVVSSYKETVQTDISRLEQTTQQELRSTSASVRTMESQLASIVGTMRQVEHVMQQTAEARLSVLHWLGLVGLVALAALGIAALSVSLWQRLV